MSQDTAQNGWQMRQADLNSDPAPQRSFLDLTIQTGSSCFADRHSFTNEAMKGSVPQGALFAYLFRRFGYPTEGWDADKELAVYRLTTPRDDMVMRISPYADGDPCLAIRFLVPFEALEAIKDYPVRNMRAHDDAFGLWVIENDLMPPWVNLWMRKLCSGEVAVAPSQKPSHWTETLKYLRYLPHSRPDGDKHPWYEWHVRTWHKYNSEVPCPPEDFRTADWTAWSDDDPLKPYVQAGLQALADLHRPVWVWDTAITPWGPLSDDDAGAEGALEEADIHPVAGLASGALGTLDPAGFEDLQRLILSLGATPEEALARAWIFLSTAKEGQS